MATHSSTLAWKIPWTEDPVRLQSMALQRVGYNWATKYTCMHACTIQLPIPEGFLLSYVFLLLTSILSFHLKKSHLIVMMNSFSFFMSCKLFFIFSSSPKGNFSGLNIFGWQCFFLFFVLFCFQHFEYIMLPLFSL